MLSLGRNSPGAGMVRNIGVCVVVAVTLIAAPTAAETRKAEAVAKMIGLDGKSLGETTFTQTGHGVLIAFDLHGMPPGPHAIHIHGSGNCDPRTHFTSAGPHFSLEPRAHGYMAKGGPHSGDLPNQVAAADGTLQASTITNAFTLGDGAKTIFDRDGAAIIVHAQPDDYASQPAGNSGARIACGVIMRTVAPGQRKGATHAAHE
jgi:Cu-Zn family superoxide dismutase